MGAYGAEFGGEGALQMGVKAKVGGEVEGVGFLVEFADSGDRDRAYYTVDLSAGFWV